MSFVSCSKKARREKDREKGREKGEKKDPPPPPSYSEILDIRPSA